MLVSRKGRAAYLGMLTPLPVEPPPVGRVSLRSAPSLMLSMQTR